MSMTQRIDAEQLFAFVEKMPAFRNSVQHLLQLAADLNADSRQIVQVIETDPLMTVKVLRVVNSPFYGLAHKISSVQRAVVHLGINSIKNMALSVAAIGVLPAENPAGLQHHDFLLHALTSAALCKQLAERLQVPVTESSDYFVAGLLHDFGKMVFAQFLPDLYKQVLQAAQTEHLPLHEVERAMIGMDHSQAGRLLAEHWGLAEDLIAAIDHHHSLQTHQRLSACLFVANQISKQLALGFAGNPVIEQLPVNCVQIFGLDLDGLIADIGDVSVLKSEALAFID